MLVISPASVFWPPGGQAVFLPPGYTGRRAQGGQMINLGQMTTSSSSSMGGREGRAAPMTGGGELAQQLPAGPSKKAPHPRLCWHQSHHKMLHQGTALSFPMPALPFIIHAFDQWHGHQINKSFSFWSFFYSLNVEFLIKLGHQTKMSLSVSLSQM